MLRRLFAARRLVEAASLDLDQRIATQHETLGIVGRNRRRLRRRQRLGDLGRLAIRHLGLERPLVHIRRNRFERDLRRAQHRLARGAVRREQDCFT